MGHSSWGTRGAEQVGLLSDPTHTCRGRESMSSCPEIAQRLCCGTSYHSSPEAAICLPGGNLS